MSERPRIAIFGVTPLTLLLGRACCLADNPPVGLYDTNESSALNGALFLGISARKEPNQLNQRSAPLGIAIVGNPTSAKALSELDPKDKLLAISLIPLEEPTKNLSLCYAAPLNTSDAELNSEAISADIPELIFRLHGHHAARLRAYEFLSGLSPNIRFGF